MTTTLLTHDIPGGAAWSALLRAGRQMTLTAGGIDANASVLLFAAHDQVDRMNVPDTLKAQMSACVRPPMVLMSDRGTALASVTASSLDWHDVLCGHSVDADVEAFGASSYADDGNDWRRSARAGLLSELRKHGRDEKDLHATVNFFSRAAIGGDLDGTLSLVRGHCHDGDFVTLRAEQDLLVVLSTAPHPLATAWSPAPVRVELATAPARSDDDPSLRFRAESARALRQAEAVLA